MDEKEALAIFLDVDENEIIRIGKIYSDLEYYKADDEYYIVGTEEDINKVISDKIKESIWRFRSWFLIDNCDFPKEFEEIIDIYKRDKKEGANKTLLALIDKCGDFKSFVQEIIDFDGRAEYLNCRHQDEYKEGNYLIYRM